MKLIFFGAPGAGKGTIAGYLKQDMMLPHISTGDLFRKAIKDKTPLGEKVESILAKGELVPDSLTISIVVERLKEDDCKKGYILDGFPRTLPQAEELTKIVDIDYAVYFDISDSEVIRRLSGRRTCSNCGAVFHIEFNKPKKEGICDNCGGALIIRNDDKEEAIRNRLEVYHNQTEILLDYYKKLNKVVVIDATQSPENVYKSLKEKIKI